MEGAGSEDSSSRLVRDMATCPAGFDSLCRLHSVCSSSQPSIEAPGNMSRTTRKGFRVLDEDKDDQTALDRAASKRLLVALRQGQEEVADRLEVPAPRQRYYKRLEKGSPAPRQVTRRRDHTLRAVNEDA